MGDCSWWSSILIERPANKTNAEKTKKDKYDGLNSTMNGARMIKPSERHFYLLSYDGISIRLS